MLGKMNAGSAVCNLTGLSLHRSSPVLCVRELARRLNGWTSGCNPLQEVRLAESWALADPYWPGHQLSVYEVLQMPHRAPQEASSFGFGEQQFRFKFSNMTHRAFLPQHCGSDRLNQCCCACRSLFAELYFLERELVESQRGLNATFCKGLKSVFKSHAN